MRWLLIPTLHCGSTRRSIPSAEQTALEVSVIRCTKSCPEKSPAIASAVPRSLQTYKTPVIDSLQTRPVQSSPLILLPRELQVEILQNLEKHQDLFAVAWTHPLFRALLVAQGKQICATIEARRWPKRARDVVDILYPADSRRTSMIARWTLKACLGIDPSPRKSGLARKCRLHDPTSPIWCTGIRRLITLEIIDKVIRARINFARHGRYTKAEVERLEEACFNILKATRNLYGLARDNDGSLCLWKGDIVVRAEMGFGCAVWEAIIDVEGLCNDLAVDEHMRVVAALKLLEGFCDDCDDGLRLREMLIATLKDRLLDRRRVGSTNWDRMNAFVIDLIGKSLWDKAQARMASLSEKL
ncbi:hypothetical protein BJ508DRAFT_307691 [Ascobolus immersus RN42]|uniref:Uncharacterized protein n=1 Tax=Ascobolus immersus RN42 TaxID=1160509 RepID=A0A3N4IEJ8_ASCIM|nr:hypothetical protein BJ508DRAFT_307691 [Ascobolus immersus RN42]